MKNALKGTILLIPFFLAGFAVAGVGDEGFESPETMFSYANYNVSYLINDSSSAHTGISSFRVNPSSCGASCFFNYRVDLTHTFNYDTPVRLIGVGLWALEGSTISTAWGGKIRIGHDGTWNLFDWGIDWWGVVGNGAPISGQWQYQYISIDQQATNVNIQLWDITSRSTLWIDDVVLYYEVNGVVQSERASWSAVKAMYKD